MANLIEENALIKDGIAFRVDYETAVEILRPLAEQGDAAAQTQTRVHIRNWARCTSR